MKCRKPYMQGIQAYGCGQCIPCRVNRRRLWTSRLVLESLTSGSSFFVTLTYNEKFQPIDKSVVPKDLQDFIKRLRRSIEPYKLRYYACGEYGDISNRPHYHMALFLDANIPKMTTQQLCDDAWCVDNDSIGWTYVGDLTSESASYIAGYVTKKMTKRDDDRLKGRHPEFARMSLRPGIGADAMDTLSTVLQTDVGLDDILKRNGDVPSFLLQGRKKLLLGRYLRRCLRGLLGLPQKAPLSSEYLAKNIEEYQKALDEVSNPSSPYYKKPVGVVLLQNDLQSVINMLGRLNLKNGDKTL